MFNIYIQHITYNYGPKNKQDIIQETSVEVYFNEIGMIEIGLRINPK